MILVFQSFSVFLFVVISTKLFTLKRQKNPIQY